MAGKYDTNRKKNTIKGDEEKKQDNQLDASNLNNLNNDVSRQTSAFKRISTSQSKNAPHNCVVNMSRMSGR